MICQLYRVVDIKGNPSQPPPKGEEIKNAERASVESVVGEERFFAFVSGP